MQRTGREAHDPYGRRVARRGRVQAETGQRREQFLLHLTGPPGGVLGLDGQLHPAARVVDQLQQPVQGEYGRTLPVPVRGLVRVLPVPPGSEVEGGEIGQLQSGDRAAAVRRAVHPAVVHTDEMAVGGEPHVAFESVGAVLDGARVRGEGVLGCVLGRPSVSDDLDAVLSYVGHRVMVPPWRGRRVQKSAGRCVKVRASRPLVLLIRNKGCAGSGRGEVQWDNPLIRRRCTAPVYSAPTCCGKSCPQTLAQRDSDRDDVEPRRKSCEHRERGHRGHGGRDRTTRPVRTSRAGCRS